MRVLGKQRHGSLGDLAIPTIDYAECQQAYALQRTQVGVENGRNEAPFFRFVVDTRLSAPVVSPANASVPTTEVIMCTESRTTEYDRMSQGT